MDLDHQRNMNGSMLSLDYLQSQMGNNDDTIFSSASIKSFKRKLKNIRKKTLNLFEEIDNELTNEFEANEENEVFEM
jgi:hypothetical protein